MQVSTHTKKKIEKSGNSGAANRSLAEVRHGKASKAGKASKKEKQVREALPRTFFLKKRNESRTSSKPAALDQKRLYIRAVFGGSERATL